MSLVAERFAKTGFAWNDPSSSSQRNYLHHIRHFERFLNTRNKTAHEGNVTDEDIREYIDQLKLTFRKNTIAVRVSAIKSYFKWLIREGFVSTMPFIRSQRVEKVQHKKIDFPVLQSIIREVKGDSLGQKRDLAMLSLIIIGFKTEEIVAINRDDIDFIENTILINGERKSFKLVAKEVAAYSDALTRRVSFSTDTQPFFLNRSGSRISGRSMRRRIHRCLPRGQFNIRDLQHTCSNNCSEALQEVRNQL